MKELNFSQAVEQQFMLKNKKGSLKADKLFLTKGVGIHPVELISFELALRNAYLEAQNLVAVSSIFPPQCEIIPKKEGVKYLSPGEITFCVLSRTKRFGEKDGELLGSAVGLALPPNPDRFGYIYECHTMDKNEEETYQEACEGALILLASSMDPQVDVYRPETIPSELKDQIYNDAMVCVAETKKGMWTTTIAAAVYIMPQ